MFKKTINILLGYATIKYGHYTGQAVQTRQPKILNCLGNPSDKDIVNDLDVTKY